VHDSFLIPVLLTAVVVNHQQLLRPTHKSLVFGVWLWVEAAAVVVRRPPRATAADLIGELACRVAYTQSDEITLAQGGAKPLRNY